MLTYDEARLFTCLMNGYKIEVYPNNPELPPKLLGVSVVCGQTFLSLKAQSFVTKSAEKNQWRKVDDYVTTKKGRTAYAEFLQANPTFLDHLRALAERVQHSRAFGRGSGERTEGLDVSKTEDHSVLASVSPSGEIAATVIPRRYRHEGSVDAAAVSGSKRAVRAS